MSADGSDRNAAERLEPLATLARAAAVSTAAEADGEGWAALGAAFAREAGRRRRRRGLAGAAVALALALALSFGGPVTWRQMHRERLSYLVDGAAPDADGYIPRVQAANAEVRFSDGTKVALARGSRARVVSTGADGAQLQLEDGRAHLSVVHRPRARWSVEAGPFVVLVTGTTFDVGWSGAEGILRVRLVAGVVTVRGPLTHGGVTLRPGEELEARPDDGVLHIEPVTPPAAPLDTSPLEAVPVPAPPAVAPPPEGPSVTVPLPPAPPLAPPPPAPSAVLPPPRPSTPRASTSWASTPRASTPRASTPRASTPRASTSWASTPRASTLPPPSLGADWSRRIASGDFDTILQQAEASGGVQCLRTLPSDRLSALGDAARYAGRTELARRALLAQRDRFAGSPAAEEAAFLLGRLAEDSHEPPAKALGWYDVYLEEAPRGAYGAEVLGRKLLLIAASGEGAPVRSVARDYLERYPAGPYAARARAILEGGR